MVGRKDVENRTWLPPTDVIGERIAIHAAMTSDGDDIEPMCQMRGVVLGTVLLVGVIEDSPSDWAQPGHYHWVLEAPHIFTLPVPVRGQRMLWHWTP